MNHRYTAVILSAFLLSLSAVAQAGTPLQDFNDDDLLVSAGSDVLKMDLEELESFIAFLAACNNDESSEAATALCGKDREAYLIKYDRGRAVDRIVRVHTFMWKYIDAQDKVAKANTPKRTDLGKLIMRYVDMRSKLAAASTMRYQVLKKVR